MFKMIRKIPLAIYIFYLLLRKKTKVSIATDSILIVYGSPDDGEAHTQA